MRHSSTFIKATGILFIIVQSLFLGTSLYAQQSISDYVIYGGVTGIPIIKQTAPAEPGYGVQFGSSSTINGGSIGSNKFIQSTGNASVSANIYSGGTIVLSNSNVVTGKIAAANTFSPASTGTILSVGSSASLGGNIDVNGNIVIGGGTLSGSKVTYPSTASYTGPALTVSQNNKGGLLTTPSLLTIPTITPFPTNNSTTDIITTATVTAGAGGAPVFRRNIILSGGKTVTLEGTGVYVFNSIKNTGTTNSFVFNFKGDATGTIKVYVLGDVDLGKVSASIINNGANPGEKRIYFETQGKGTSSSNGTFAWSIANGSAGNGSKWVGSIWAPYAAINIGSGTGTSNITGALWSGTQVNIQSGITLTYAPFIFCNVSAIISSQTNVACFGGTGSITVAGANGTTPYSFSKDGTTFQSSGTFSNLVAGNYTITVKDANLCTTPQAVTITQPASLTASITTQTNVLCNGNSTGAVTLAGSGGAGTYTYSKDGSIFQSSGTFSNLTAGNYTITVKDANLCTTPQAVTITQPASLTASITTQTNVLCNGNSTGAVTLAGSGGASPYGYSKDGTNFVSSGVFGGLVAGDYTITVKDANLCITTQAVTITQPAASPVITSISSNAPICWGTALNLSSNVTGGTGNFSYNWSGPNSFASTSPTPTISNAMVTASGTYSLVVTDANGCTTATTNNTLDVTVNALPDANAGPDKPYNFDGITTLTGSTTTTDPSVTYLWTAPPGGIISAATPVTQATINVEAPGIYKLAVTAAGCTSTDNVEVSNKVNKLIGSELTSIYWNNPTGLPSPFFIIKNGKVRIDVIVQVNNYAYVLNLLQQAAYGLTNIVTNGVNGLNGSQLIITGDYPIINLLKLNLLGTYINFCRPFYEAFSNAGLVTSAGDTTMRSHFVRSGYKINGDGVKVGVISNSYATITNGTTATLPLQPITDPPNPIAQTFTINTVAVDISNGDLPGDTTILGIHSVNPKGFNKNVHVLQDYPATSTDEGRAMLQIVHDVAPGAELYFRTGFLTAGDFATGINELTAAGCKVIVDDVTYITEPYLKDGVVAKAVDAAKLNGVSYFSAAGNFKNKSYEKDFKPVDASQAGFAGKVAHDFSGGGDIFQHITLAPGNYTIVLQWVDDIYTSPIGQISGTKFDLDMFWTSNTNGTGLKGFNRDNTNGDPLEIMPFTINTTTDASFLILNNTSGGFPARIKYIIYRGDVQILEWPGGTSTVVGQANALGAIAVGAARFDKVPSYQPYKLSAPLIEDYSSIGGTKTEGVVRQKPDLVAPDGGNTTVKMGQDYSNTVTGVQLDGYSNFFGTSAAAPHAAAVAALIMQGRKKFLDQATTTPDAIKSLLQLSAVDMETAGFDFISGFGLVNADSAMRTFAAPIDSIIKVVVPAGIVPCSGTEFTVSIIGENFSYNTVVYLINGPGDSIKIIPTFVSSTEVTVKISSCVGNPEIKAYTPPKAGTNGTDGGFSNSKYFFSAAITITANDISKKYGEILTPPSFTIKVDGVLLQSTTNPPLTLADIGLTNLTATTAATSQSDVGTYVITFNQYAPGDAALLKKYSYKFTDGKVTIAQMPLKVTPDDKTLTYGQAVGKVTFKYEFNEANVYSTTDLKNTIKSFHEAFLPKNALAVVKDFKKPQGGYILSNTDLANMNMMASFNAVKNSRKFTLANNMLVPITDPGILQDNLNIQYLVDVASESIYDYAKIDKTTAKFYPGYPNINPKALLSASSIESDDNSKGVIASGGSSSLKILNGLLSQMINSGDGSIVPIVNGSLIQIVDAQMTDDNGIPLVPTVLAQYVNNGSWVILTNGVTGTTSLKILNGALKILNGTTTTSLKILNGTTTSLKILNGTTEVTVDPTVQVLGTTTALKVLNNIVYKVINGVDVPIPDGSFVQLGDGGLAQVKNGSFQVVANTAVLNGLTGSSLKILNGSTGSSLKILNGTTGSSLKILNTGALGTGAANNNTAVVLDSEDGTNDGDGTSALGNMFGINMITGLDVGKQYLVPGVLVNPNFDISYGLGTVDIAKAEITITPLPNTRDYDGSTTAAAIPTITIGALAGGDIAVLKETYDNNNAGTGKSMIPTVVSIVDALGASTTANYNVTPNPLANGVINKIPLTVTAENKTKQYGENNPPLTYTYSGFVNNEDSVTSGIKGANNGTPALTTTATQYSAIGTTYPISISSGTLTSLNYTFTTVPGLLNIIPNNCPLLSHDPMNFVSTSKVYTSLWTSVTIKVSGQLTKDGDYIVVRAGDLTLNNITSTAGNSAIPIPNGKIIADSRVVSPVTTYDALNNMWTTKVPLFFASTSDIFITGAIINADNGFTAKNSTANSVIRARFYSNKNFSDKWVYQMAAYQPQFTYGQIDKFNDLGVQSINGIYRAGTPIPQILNIVNGGSGNGGTNYTGSQSNQNSFTACAPSSDAAVNRVITNASSIQPAARQQVQDIDVKGDIQVFPNPASAYITLSYIPASTGNSAITLFTIDGKKVMEIDNGVREAGKKYVKRIDVSRLIRGVYIIQVIGTDKTTIKKIIISR